MEEPEHLARQIKHIIIRALKLNVEADEIGDDEIIFGDGIGADSTSTLEIVFAVEEAFGIEVEDEDLRVELFSSVRALRDFVEGKLRDRGELSPRARSLTVEPKG
ncbi:MAG: phosphopantetheine-binding protein [Candidatus Latescibacteria bacterium]|jgi:acyl carrier protein|nr:phosphopantetheine-binding protein [Candidatus Latescibacterota bacterium]